MTYLLYLIGIIALFAFSRIYAAIQLHCWYDPGSKYYDEKHRSFWDTEECRSDVRNGGELERVDNRTSSCLKE